MPLLIVLLELFIATLAIWVLTFEVAIYSQMSIVWLEVSFLLSWTLMLVFLAKPWLQRLRVIGRAERVFARNTLIVGCLVGLVVLVASRPDADDGPYMRQLLVDASTPGGSFTANPFYIPFGGEHIEIPFLSENEAWEAMVVTLAHLLRIDPLQAYHNVFAFGATIIWVLTYALLFRRFRVPRNKVWLALVVTVVFLFLDGNLHRSFGNFSLIRIWQGKVIAWAVLQPAFLLFALRFLARPNRYRFSLLLATGVVSFFINRSSMFLFAVLGAAVALSYLLAFKRNRRRRMRVLVPIFAVIPLWLLGAYLALYVLPAGSSVSSVLSDMSESEAAAALSQKRITRSWWTSLGGQVIGGPLTLWRDAFFLTVVPLVTVARPLHRFLPLLSLSVAFLALSPFTGPTWFYFFPKVYWRLYYALPLPLCVGLSICLLLPSRAAGPRRVTKFALAAVLVVSTLLAVEVPVLSKANSVDLKSPLEYRFPAQPLAFAESVAPRLDGKRVLAPSEISNIWALTDFASIELSYGRVAGNAARMANHLVSQCKVNSRTVPGMRLLLRRGVDAVVMSSCSGQVMKRLGRLLPEYRLEEEEDAAAFGYRLYWVTGPSDPRPLM